MGASRQKAVCLDRRKTLEFDLLAGQGDCTATGLHEGRLASRSFNTPHLRKGYELIEEADFLREASRVADQAIEKAIAPVVDAGQYDLVLDLNICH